MHPTTQRLLQSTPNRPGIDTGLLGDCIDACGICAAACAACADACLGEADLAAMRRCVRLNLDCADVCAATGVVASRTLDPDLPSVRALLEACVRICAACGAECARHGAKVAHCAACAEACRTCEQACRKLLAGWPGSA